MKRSASRRSGFTLKEILIVIGIISMLIALLMPVLGKARRRALVLTCPIVYIASSDKQWDAKGTSVHLVNPGGTVDLEIYRAPENSKVEDVLWSPTGQRLAINVYGGMYYPGSGEAYHHKYDIIIVDPASGVSKSWKRPNTYQLKGWIDDNHLSVHGNGWFVMNVETGAQQRIDEHKTRFSIEEHSLAAHHSDARYVAYGTWWDRREDGREDIRFGVAMARKDFSRGKLIWQQWRINGWDNITPAIDPMGEWVAWTQYNPSGNGYSTVVIKHVKAPSAAPPEVIMSGYQWHPQFCDWSEDGKLLVIGEDKGFKGLLLLDKSGKVLSKIPTEKLPWKARWRHYRHR